MSFKEWVEGRREGDSPPTFRGVGVLAIIVLIPTFLSMTLEVEIEGRRPWQKRPAEAGHRDVPAARRR